MPLPILGGGMLDDPQLNAAFGMTPDIQDQIRNRALLQFGLSMLGNRPQIGQSNSLAGAIGQAGQAGIAAGDQQAQAFMRAKMAAQQMSDLAEQRKQMAALAEQRAAETRAREEAMREAANSKKRFQELLSQEDNPDEISVLRAGIQSGAMGPQQVTQFMGQVMEKRATREQRIQELQMRYEDSAIAREEKATLARDLARMRAEDRAESIRLRSALAGSNAGSKMHYDTERGILVDKVTGQAMPVTLDDKPIGKKETAAAQRASLARDQEQVTIESVRKRAKEMGDLIQSNPAVVGLPGAARRVAETAIGAVSPGTPTPAIDYQNKIALMIGDTRKLLSDSQMSNQDRQRLETALGGGMMQTPSSAIRTINDVLQFIETKKGVAPAGGAQRPTTQAEFNALPRGAVYIDPDDGKQYRKP